MYNKLELTQMIEKRTNEIYILLISIYLVFAIFYVFFGDMNYDEGWYLYASKAVYFGKTPYIDFSYTQSPLLPYIYGIPQLLFGPSLYVGRLTSLFFGILTCIFTIKVAEKFGGKVGAVIALALISLSPFTIYFFTIVKTYALTAFFIALSFYFLFANENIKNPAKSMLAAFFISLSLGVRFSILPVVFLLVIYILYTERYNIRTIVLTIGTVLITSGLLFLPFLIINKDLLIFNLIGYHLGETGSSLIEYFFNKTFSSLTIISSIVNKFFVILILMSVGLILLLGKRKHFKDYLKIYVLYMAVFSVFFVNLIPCQPYDEYLVILVPLASILAGYGFSEIYNNSKHLLLMALFLILLEASLQNRMGVTSYGYKLIHETEEMADYIKNHTPEDGKLLAFSTYVAVRAEREVLPGFEMSLFSYHPSWSNDKAEKYKVINKDLLNQRIKSKSASAILLTTYELKVLDADTIHLIEENYYLAKSMNWGPDTAYLYSPRVLSKP